MSGRRGGDEVDWDFSFVDDELPPRPAPHSGRPTPAPTGDVDDVTWDFSFVGEPTGGSRRERPAHAPTRAGETDDVTWDFSFVDSERSEQLPPGRPAAVPAAPSGAAPGDEVAWDFSFVDGGERQPAPPGAARSGSDEPRSPLIDPTPVHPLERALAPRPDRRERESALDRTPADAPDRAPEPTSGSQPELDLALEPEPLLDPTPIASPDPTFDLAPTERRDPAVDVVATDGSGEVDRSGPARAQGAVPPAARTADPDGIDPTDELPAPDRLDPLPAPAPEPAVSSAAAPSAPRPPAPNGSAEVPVLDVAAFEPVKILSICTHNRTRSVMMMGLLQDGFDKELGPDVVMVRSLGTGPEGEEPIIDAVEQMAQRGIDVSGHRSLQITAPRVEPADLILTAERDHVVRIAELSPETFARTFTLPEFCRKVAADPVAGRRSLRQWVTSLSAGRTPAAYLAEDVPEVDDPTGSPPRQFQASTLTIEAMCQTVVDLLAPAIEKALREAQRAAAGRPD